MSFCTNCGTELQETARFCPECGQVTSATAPTSTPAASLPMAIRTPSAGTTNEAPIADSQEADTSADGWGWVIAGAVVGVIFGFIAASSLGVAGFILGFGLTLLVGFASKWVAQDANNRGLDGGSWATGTFLLAIVFFPAYLFQRSNREVIVGTKVCPVCAERVKAEATKCRYCGADVSQVVSHQSVDIAIDLKKDVRLKTLTAAVSEQSELLRKCGDNCPASEVFEYGRRWALLFDETGDVEHRAKALAAMTKARAIDPKCARYRLFGLGNRDWKPYGNLMNDSDFRKFWV
jgi:RNA polymerase subunit RPABC4/transcription elongation factor Spt4